jgi:hypothetical protein
VLDVDFHTRYRERFCICRSPSCLSDDFLCKAPADQTLCYSTPFDAR